MEIVEFTVEMIYFMCCRKTRDIIRRRRQRNQVVRLHLRKHFVETSSMFSKQVEPSTTMDTLDNIEDSELSENNSTRQYLPYE
ncbi:unnamed protein product [Enterobius vermicularis]|uniref:Uncharacterized protein n=1 Tax=Enterobius vermicularis TaxID=51028 RepID=A0A0N4VMI8_ENTVE|nr:unnamed protein product [Enterobius vermicularis]